MDGGAMTLVRPHLFTVAEYYRMAEAGILDEDSRVELIRGQILDMCPIGTPHSGMVIRLTRLLSEVVRGRAFLSVQNPVRLDDTSEPQPDMALLRPRDDDYEAHMPGPLDVLLLIEVADTSLRIDRILKAPLYAESGIGEYWIVNLDDRVVEVHRAPRDGVYTDLRTIGPEQRLEIAALPGTSLPAAEVLRPAAAG